MRERIVIPFLLLLSLFSCRPAGTISCYEEILGECWHEHEEIALEVEIPDSGFYQVTVCIRYTCDYEWSDLWCVLSTRSRMAVELRDTLGIKMLLPDGRRLGEGKELKTIGQPLRKNPVLLPEGRMVFRLRPAMDMRRLPGIKNVGVCLVPVENTKLNVKNTD